MQCIQGMVFLSENYLFSKALEKNNIIFIGPPANAIKEMGDKISSKKIALRQKLIVFQVLIKKSKIMIMHLRFLMILDFL